MRREKPSSGSGFFGIGVYHIKSEVNIGTLMRSAHAFGASFAFTVGRRYKKQASDTTKAWRHIPLFRFDTIESLKGNLPFGCSLVGVELSDGAIELPAYIHPERACYLLGAEDHGMPEASLRQCHEVVKIPGASACLNVSAAGTVVIYDRVSKRIDR